MQPFEYSTPVAAAVTGGIGYDAQRAVGSAARREKIAVLVRAIFEAFFKPCTVVRIDQPRVDLLRQPETASRRWPF
jgi:hypothetical protein